MFCFKFGTNTYLFLSDDTSQTGSFTQLVWYLSFNLPLPVEIIKLGIRFCWALTISPIYLPFIIATFFLKTAIYIYSYVKYVLIFN